MVLPRGRPAGPPPAPSLRGAGLRVPPTPALAPVRPRTAAAIAAAAAAATANRVAKLEATIEADPYDAAAWDARLLEAVKEGSPTDWFEKAVAQFPTGAKIWGTYAEWYESQDPAMALTVYRRCLQSVPVLPLWQSYINLSKRYRHLEDIFTAYKEAVDLLGTDGRAGTMWSEYLSLLKHAYNLIVKSVDPSASKSGRLLTEDASPIELARRAMKPGARARVLADKALSIGDGEFLRVAQLIGVDASMLRAVFQRALSTAHASLDKVWTAYVQFEKSFGDPHDAQKFLDECEPTYLRAKTAYKELQTLSQGIDYFATPAPAWSPRYAQQEQLLERWRRIVHYERTNPLCLERQCVQVRVSLLYQQALLGLAYHAEVWYDFSSWLDWCGQKERATQVLQHAVRKYLPQELSLRLFLAHRHEVAETPASAVSFQAAEGEYQGLLDDMPKPCPLALINALAFVRRQSGASAFRDRFRKATESSAHCTWEVYVFAALTEYHVFSEFGEAAKVFRLGLERYGDREPSLLAAYVNFLVGANDLKSARGELSRGVLALLQVGVRDSLANRAEPARQEDLAFLWQKWARLERYFGDACAVPRAIEFRDGEYQDFQRDQDVEEDAIAATPVSLGLSTTIAELEEGFRFQHLVPRSVRSDHAAPSRSGAASAPASALARASAAAGSAAARPLTVDDAVDGTRRNSVNSSASISTHIARPDVSKMFVFHPASDVVGPGLATVPDSRRTLSAGSTQLGKPSAAPGPAGDAVGRVLPRSMERPALPAMIPACLQDLLAMLPARPLKGAKPDVDYMLTVLQTVTIPPVAVKDLEHLQAGTLPLATGDDGLLGLKRLIKEESDSTSLLYHDRLQAKRRKVMSEEPAKPA